MPVQQETLLDAEELSFDHDLGTVTYAVAHWVDEDAAYDEWRCNH